MINKNSKTTANLDFTQVSLGNVPGYSIINKTAINIDIDTGTLPEDITGIGGVYTGFPESTLETVSLFSSSALDTLSGTGARSINISGLDANYNQQSEIINLNGVTPVNSVNQYRRVNSAFTNSAGSLGDNQGIITCRHTTTTANVFFAMPLGRNQTNVSAYTIPSGYQGLLMYFMVSVLAGAAVETNGVLRIRKFGFPWRSIRSFTASLNGRFQENIIGGLLLPEKTDIIVRMLGTTGSNVSATSNYDLLLEEN